MPSAHSTHDLTDVDLEILNVLASADGEGYTLGGDLAGIVEVPANAIGSRLAALVRRGFITGRYFPEARSNGWLITPEGWKAVAHA
jgi:hypothetical protein